MDVQCNEIISICVLIVHSARQVLHSRNRTHPSNLKSVVVNYNLELGGVNKRQIDVSRKNFNEIHFMEATCTQSHFSVFISLILQCTLCFSHHFGSWLHFALKGSSWWTRLKEIQNCPLTSVSRPVCAFGMCDATELSKLYSVLVTFKISCQKQSITSEHNFNFIAALYNNLPFR